MKGIAHFVSGVAVATCFPEIVHSASQSLAFGPALGGLAGLLPDTLDFKVTRYFRRVDDEIDPAEIVDGLGNPHPQSIADRIARAMNRAYMSDETVQIRLHTVRLGADLWRRWNIAFDLARSEVVVGIGPVVTTAQVPFAGSELPGLEPGRAQVHAHILQTYDAETQIDVFDGPSLAFERVDDALHVTFLPWHRAWSHSLLMALSVGVVGWLLAPAYGLAMALAVLAHIVEDQIGFMGCNLLFPASRKRTRGLGWIHSGEAIPNFLIVWVGLAVILLNLDRFSETPILPVLPYVLVVIVLPCLSLLALSVWPRLRAKRQPAEVGAAVEALDETDEIDI